jgi:hypothetical protein
VLLAAGAQSNAHDYANSDSITDIDGYSNRNANSCGYGHCDGNGHCYTYCSCYSYGDRNVPDGL